LKKRTKKLLDLGLSLSEKAEAKRAKVFCFLFSKKRTYLALLQALSTTRSGWVSRLGRARSVALTQAGGRLASGTPKPP
jgi:hypothetical protein